MLGARLSAKWRRHQQDLNLPEGLGNLLVEYRGKGAQHLRQRLRVQLRRSTSAAGERRISRICLPELGRSVSVILKFYLKLSLEV